MPESSTFFTQNENHSFPRCWLGVAIVSLMLSGLAPLLLIAGRASIYAEMEFVKQWFVPVLVVHVNLSVGLWFLAVAAMLWSFVLHSDKTRYIQKAANLSFLGAVLAIAIAPVMGGEAYTSNYIPVQDNILFFAGLGLATASLTLMIYAVLRNINWQDLFHFMVGINAITVAVALLCFFLSIQQHPEGFGGEAYYEMIFWGGGHLLQFVYVQLAIIAWVWLAKNVDIPVPKDSILKIFFITLLIAVAVSPAIYAFVDINSYYHLKFFTWQMNIVTGTVPGLLMFYFLWKFTRGNFHKHLPATVCLLMSLILFLEGGALGYLIEGSNVTIPAHYHGSTVGVTLALMGLVYLIMPILGMESLSANRLAIAQPILYGVGQIMHASGLAWAGSHDIARKTAGALTESQQGAEVALQVMRFGGLLAVLGGGLFVFLLIRAFIRAKRKKSAS